MEQFDFSHFLFLIRLYALEICETLVFVAIAISLTVHTFRLIIAFGRKGKE